MVRRLSIIVAIGLAVGGCSLLPLPKGDSPASPSEQVGKIAKEITVIIDGCNSGSGVLYKREGNTYYVLTAKHTFKQQDAICLVFAPKDEKPYTVDSGKVTVPVPGVDLAVLTFKSDKTYKLAEWGDSEKAAAGQIVYVAGAPAPSEAIQQRTLLVPDGKILGIKPQSNGYALIYNNLTNPGMSGGPVLDEQGRVIGIHGQSDRENGEKTGFNLGIPIQMFLKPDRQMPIVTRSLDKNNYSDQEFVFVEFLGLALLTTLSKWAYWQLGKARPLRKYHSIIPTTPDVPDYLKGADSQMAKGNQPEPAKDATAHFNQEFDLQKQSDLKDALAQCSQTIAFFQTQDAVYYIDVAEAYYSRGNVRRKLGDSQGAIADYTEAIRINPNYADAYVSRGNVRRDLGNKPAALADYNEAIRINSNLAAAYNNRGLVHRDMGNKQGARKDFHKAAALHRQQGNQEWYQDSLNNLKALLEQ